MNCRTFYGVEIAVMRRFPRPFALGLAVVLATGLLNGVVVRAEAETEFQPRALRRTPSVPVARPVGGSTTAVAGEPASVRVEVFDHERAQGQGHHVMVFGVGRADGVAEPGQVRVEVDYTGFRSAYGADWSNRLRLVSLPVCALTAPDRPDCRAVPVASANDAAGGRVSAQVTAATGGSLYALDATPSGNTGDFTATSLSSAGSWSVGGSSGEFSWSYPLAVPPGLGGPTPKLALAYSSQSVDGHTAASNNQPSWIGEGFDLWPGYIERRYKACADDMGAGANNTVKTGDECWGPDNAVLSLGGGGNELVRDDNTGAWHPRHDDGSRIEHLTGAVNADNDGEYWKVTTVDGTQYFFGLNHLPSWSTCKAETHAAWATPVFGNNSGEQCHRDTFDASWCQQAYRWNLDYVVDPHGNSMSYWYTPETNSYARNQTDSAAAPYGTPVYARYVDVGASHSRTALDGGRGWRRTNSVVQFDGYGMPTQTDESGDAAVAGDEQCAR